MGREVSGASSSCRQSCARGCGATRSPGRPPRGSSAPLQHNPIRRNPTARRANNHKRFRCASARLGLDCTHCGCRGRTAAGAKPEPVRASPRFGPGEPRRGAGWPPPCRGAGARSVPGFETGAGARMGLGTRDGTAGAAPFAKSIRSTILRIGVVSPTGLIALGI